MHRILRQLTPDEMRQVAHHCGARECASPEEVIRCLAKHCGALTWGIFPAATPDALLDQVGQSLGMPPLMGGLRGLQARERAIFGVYLRQAWDTADVGRRTAIIHLALAAWDNPSLPRPEALTYPEETGWGPPVPEPLLQHATGCRALATALQTHPLNLPEPAHRGGLGVVVSRRPSGHQMLFQVLLVLWRARARVLRERKVQRVELSRQLQQLDSLITIRRRHLSEEHVTWSRNPQSGLALTAAAGLSAAVHLALAAGPVYLIPAGVVGAAGLVWAAAARVSRPQRPSDSRVQKLSTQIHSLRHQLVEVEREILTLETE